MKIFELMKPIDNEKDITDVYSSATGGVNNYSDEKLENVLQFIEKHCTEALLAFKRANLFLYRGIGYDTRQPAIFLAITPKFRPPSGQTYNKQYLFDMILSSQGFMSLRTNSICTSSVLMNALDWGNPYFIFPLNGFSFTWSKFIEDVGGSPFLSAALDDIEGNIDPKIGPSIKQSKNFINRMKYKNNDFSGALKSGHEISIHGQYVAIQTIDHSITQQIGTYFGIDL